MAMRLGEVNAHVIRLDALGKRLTEMADIDSHEFNFELEPPTGGPERPGAGAIAPNPILNPLPNRLLQRLILLPQQLNTQSKEPLCAVQLTTPNLGPPAHRGAL